jgi:predicted nucleic acid-binding protein
MLRDVPDGVHCFVDANIFYYHLVDTPPLSDDCSDFLKRLERGDVIGTTSTAAIAEVTHKVMLADAVRTHNLDRKGLVVRLKRQPQLLAALTEQSCTSYSSRSQFTDRDNHTELSRDGSRPLCSARSAYK